MEPALSTEDLLHLADACNEFCGDASSFGELLTHRVVPLPCVHASILCLVTRRHLINCMSAHINMQPTVPSTGEPACSAACGKAAHADILQAAGVLIDVHACAEIQTPDPQLLVTSRQGYAGRMLESRLMFVAPSSSRDRLGALRLMRLIAPHLHAALLRVRGANPSGLPRLTRAEKRVAHWLLCGRTNKEIAQALGRSEATIRNQLHSLFSKLGVGRRSVAIEFLKRLNFDAPPLSTPA